MIFIYCYLLYFDSICRFMVALKEYNVLHDFISFMHVIYSAHSVQNY